MRLQVLALAIAVTASSGLADEWPSPVIREVFSHSRTWFVRVLPGKSFGDTVGFAGAPLGPYAGAEFYHLEKDRSYRLSATAQLLNPVAPMDFFVTDGGVLITLDNWHNMGYGKIVAFYTNDGKPIKAYALSDLFTPQEIAGFIHSVSSIRWREAAGSYIRQGEDTFNVTVNETGAGFVFDVAGHYQYCATRSGSFLCRSSNRAYVWSAYREPGGKR